MLKNFLNPWGVVQKTQGRKRKFDEVKTDLAEKVVEETRRLKEFRHALDAPSPGASATNANARFSAIQASLQHSRLER